MLPAKVEHLCSCGTAVSLPLGRSEWRIEYDGESVSVWPSTCNWRLPYGSHYIIEKGHTRWSVAWSEKEIQTGRARDRKAKADDIARRRRKSRWWSRIWDWLGQS